MLRDEQYRLLFENMTEGFYLSEIVLDERGRPCDLYVLDANPAFSRNTGLPDPVGRTIREILPLVEQSWFDRYGEVALTGRSARFVDYNGGTGRWYDVYAYSPERGKVAVIFSDATELKQSEAALRESEERFRTLANNISQLAWMADSSGWIFWYNKRWFDYTGTTLEEMEGWGWRKVHHPDHVDRVVEKISQCFETGEFWEDTFPLRGKDGNYRWFLSRAVPIRDDDGRVVRWFGTNTDVTEELETQRELERRNAELQQFAYVASHDLQEPLRMVTAYLELVESKYSAGLDERGRQYLRYAVEGGHRAKGLISDLLAYTKVESSPGERDRVNMSEALSTVLLSLEPQIQEEEAIITHDPLPYIVANRGQIELVLQNLISNAIKFYGGDAPRVHISVEKGPNEWLFSVHDNGIGISPEYHDKLFILFQRLHTREEYKGTGMGLAIAKKIVERHGGRIWVESTPGRGSTFHFTIPREGLA